jgi:hypothetical protein
MRNRNRLLGVIGALLLILPASAFAQGSSLSAFSPYTFYGLGDFSVQGPAFLRSMGGIGVAYANGRRMNYLNPASYSAVNPRSVLFNVGGEMYNIYAKTADSKTSYNTFNVRDVSMQIPLAKRLGFGFSMTPLSDVGYRVKMTEMDPFMLANVGNIVYDYEGEGNTTQFKFGLGWSPFKRFSFGADVIYYHGVITRNFNTIISPMIEEKPQRSMLGTQRETYSQAGVTLGIQYDFILNDNRSFTFGATFRPRVNLRPETTRTIVAKDVFIDTVDYKISRSDYYLPSTFTAGLYYQTRKVGMGLDYTFEKWKGINQSDLIDGIRYRNNNFIKVGMQFTPNAQDVRRYFNRCTYRVGFRYNSYYMNINDHNIDDKAITLGFGFPIRQGLSCINVGFDFGQRGMTASGIYTVPPSEPGGLTSQRAYQMVRERYFRVSVELTLFGEDYWFLKQKYQ